MTREEFIENAPLYTRVELADFSPPQSITRTCGNKRCKRETTWLNRVTTRVDINGISPTVQLSVVGYMCGLCQHNSLVVIYEMLDWTNIPKGSNLWLHLAVRKIGQLPPQEIEIPAELSSRLGSMAGHYKKALICRSQNYGIGAMAYLRRVVDEKTDDLIDVMVELSRAHNVSDEEVSRLLAAKGQTRYEDKLKVASELIPDAIKPSGVNPLGQLYKHTSIGLHGKTDDECIAIFDDLKIDFEYVFRNLHLQAEEQRQFVRRVQERAGKA